MKNTKTFKLLIERVLEVGSRFPNKWDEKTHYIDLVEEIGELGNALLIKNGDKSSKRQRAELGDSFADILFELIMMSEECGVDLEKELVEMLDALEKRIENKDYEDEE